MVTIRRHCRNISFDSLFRAARQVLAVPHRGVAEKGVISSYKVNGNLSHEEFVFVSLRSWFHPMCSLIRQSSKPSEQKQPVLRNRFLRLHGVLTCWRTAFLKSYFKYSINPLVTHQGNRCGGRDGGRLISLR
jgi:hypothetical protein